MQMLDLPSFSGVHGGMCPWVSRVPCSLTHPAPGSPHHGQAGPSPWPFPWALHTVWREEGACLETGNDIPAQVSLAHGGSGHVTSLELAALSPRLIFRLKNLSTSFSSCLNAASGSALFRMARGCLSSGNVRFIYCCPSHEVTRMVAASRGNGHCLDKCSISSYSNLTPFTLPFRKSAIHKLINIQPCDLSQPDSLLANANYYWLLRGQNSHKNIMLEIYH